MTLTNATAAQLGLSIDDVLIFQSTAVRLLAAAAQGRVDLNELARDELAARGLDEHGRWIGFDHAADRHHVRQISSPAALALPPPPSV